MTIIMFRSFLSGTYYRLFSGNKKRLIGKYEAAANDRAGHFIWSKEHKFQWPGKYKHKRSQSYLAGYFL